jgi:uncharacterized protein YqfA (UPF0365 family)
VADCGHSGGHGTVRGGAGVRREAERLADHEVDQAFSQSLRQASLEKPKLSGKALALQQRVTELQTIVKSDQARIAVLTGGAGTTADVSKSSDLDVAKAQLGLDQNELDDHHVACGNLANIRFTHAWK